MNEEALKISQNYQKIMLDFLKSKGGSCTYGELVEEGEKHHCDSLAAILASLKRRKAIGYDKILLMHPLDDKETVKLLNENYDPFKMWYICITYSKKINSLAHFLLNIIQNK